MSASQTGRTITFTYTAATGGINNGSVTLVVPAGWSAPSTTGANAGYTTASSGTVSVASQTITVSSLTIAGGSTFTITYGSTASGGPGATATSLDRRADLAGTGEVHLRRLARQPRLLTEHHRLRRRRHRHADDTDLGRERVADRPHDHLHLHRRDRRHQQRLRHARRPRRLERTVDHRRERRLHDRELRAPSRSPRQTITVSSLTLAGGSTFTITYGDTGSGGPGATATSSTGAQTWQAQEKSTSAGSLANLGSSPSITVYAADGSGTLTTPTTNVSASQTGRTITFTYTAATGGINNGSVTLVVPAGWSAPSTTGANAGYSTSSAGTLAVAAQTITVSSLTLAGGIDLHDHLRLDGRRRARRDRNVEHRRADLASAGEVHLRRLARQPCLLTQHHRQRGRRRRHPHHTDDQRLCVPDRPHDHLHLHGADRRHQQRLRHARRPRRLERTVDHRRERRLLHLERRHTRRRFANHHRLLGDPRRR